jgi:hypothetical protein
MNKVQWSLFLMLNRTVWQGGGRRHPDFRAHRRTPGRVAGRGAVARGGVCRRRRRRAVHRRAGERRGVAGAGGGGAGAAKGAPRCWAPGSETLNPKPVLRRQRALRS